MRSVEEITSRFREITGKDTCMSHAWLQSQIDSGMLRELTPNVVALFDKDLAGEEYVTNFVWWGDKSEVIGVLRNYRTKLSDEAHLK